MVRFIFLVYPYFMQMCTHKREKIPQRVPLFIKVSFTTRGIKYDKKEVKYVEVFLCYSYS